MKSITKVSFTTVALAVVVTSAAFADDQQLQNRLALQRSEATRDGGAMTTIGSGRSESRFEVRYDAHGQHYGSYVPVRSEGQPMTTVGAYANQRGVGRSVPQNMRSESRFEFRFDAHGQRYGTYVSAK